jgi:hypothetical protein
VLMVVTDISDGVNCGGGDVDCESENDGRVDDGDTYW